LKIFKISIYSSSKYNRYCTWVYCKPYTIVGSSAAFLDLFIDEPGNEGEGLEEYGNNICIKYGLNPYLYSDINNGNGNGNYNNGDSNRRYSDNTPLSDEIKHMISTLKCDPKVQILKDTRHNTLLKIADSILFRYYDEVDKRFDLTDLHDFFVLINTNCCKPELEKGEREQIWRNAVEFVSRKKASESTQVLSVSQALREKSGKGKIVRGIISSVSTPFKVYTKLSFKCVDCNEVNDAVNIQTTPGMPIIYSNLDTYKPQRCVKDKDENYEENKNPHQDVTLFFKCEEESKSDEGRIIKIQNTDFTKNTDDTLEVLLTGDNIDGVRAGETVTIHGSLHNTSSLLLPPFKNRKIIAVMRCNTITYEGRQNLDISKKDIEIFKRFANYDKIDVITRLINYTAPQVIREKIKKLGGLIGIVGGVEKEGQRGRIHVLYIGSMGLAKTLLILELVKMTPNARFLTIDTSSAKSALGIVERENEVTTLIYGPIPLCSGSIIGLDEIQQWGFDDQGNLRSVMEEGVFTLLRYGNNRPIIARTTIFATMNPQDIVYTNRTKISKDEVTMVRPILDRFDLI
jgi:DNA replicative helicase MCM subunit Mcm2 (Cdc46/Mcm family)